LNPMWFCQRLPEEAHGRLQDVYWDSYDAVGPFVLADGSDFSRWPTFVRVAWDASYLYATFACTDQTIQSRFRSRDEPLYEEEVVEIFLAPHERYRYFEFNLSPANVVFDSKIEHDGRDFRGDPAWDCAGLVSDVQWEQESMQGNWKGYLAIPFASLGALMPRRGDVWAVNCYRIKREGGSEFSCWSPTMTKPANFHEPSRFGQLVFTE